MRRRLAPLVAAVVVTLAACSTGSTGLRSIPPTDTATMGPIRGDQQTTFLRGARAADVRMTDQHLIIAAYLVCDDLTEGANLTYVDRDLRTSLGLDPRTARTVAAAAIVNVCPRFVHPFLGPSN
jgi:hypothetical protein